ncbi:MAG: SusD/RagB family nutrient-binding outer membrane lipoprotein [Bacteroidota bacterium]|nr:MAG: SusD/RagB family nutrient-binding outer membrane lipoprotein [Bacteroidota bacterium]
MIKTKQIFSTLFLVICLLSCENWLDVNQNPDAPLEVDYQQLLPAGTSSLAYVMGGRYQVLGALWSQHWTQSPGASQYSGIDAYNINSSTFDENQFGELYSGALVNLEKVRIGARAGGEFNYYLIATVLQCYTYQVLADLYNQIPFSEALKGGMGNTEPKYEAAEAIYDSLIARIDLALAQDFEKDDLLNPATDDLVFEGNMEQWVAFANSLKLRIFLRQSEVNPQKARDKIIELYASNPDFLDNSAALHIYTNESGRRNPLYETEYQVFGKNPNLILSATLYSFLIENRDFDRLDALFELPASGGEHKALVQGNFFAPDEPSGTNSSSFSKPVMRADAPVFLMSDAESYLLQAEAIVRYQVGTYQEARENYEKAITASYAMILNSTISNAGVIGLAQQFYRGVYAFPAEGNETDEYLQAIAIQKWLSLSGIQNLETFFESNRTGYPTKSSVPAENTAYIPGELTLSVNNATSGRFPRRLVFPESEYANNRNTPAKKEVWEPVWWDVLNN